MPVTEHNDVVEAVPADRTDEPLRMSVLPRRSWCNRSIPNAHCSKAADEDVAINAIPIAKNVTGRLPPAVCIGELMANPLRARMCRYAQPQNLTPTMP